MSSTFQGEQGAAERDVVDRREPGSRSDTHDEPSLPRCQPEAPGQLITEGRAELTGSAFASQRSTETDHDDLQDRVDRNLDYRQPGRYGRRSRRRPWAEPGCGAAASVS